jgi:hypothetical protein
MPVINNRKRRNAAGSGVKPSGVTKIRTAQSARVELQVRADGVGYLKGAPEVWVAYD